MSDEFMTELSKKIKDNNDSAQFVTDLQSSLKLHGYQLWIATTHRHNAEWTCSLHAQTHEIKNDPNKFQFHCNCCPD